MSEKRTKFWLVGVKAGPCTDKLFIYPFEDIRREVATERAVEEFSNEFEFGKSSVDVVSVEVVSVNLIERNKKFELSFAEEDE